MGFILGTWLCVVPCMAVVTSWALMERRAEAVGRRPTAGRRSLDPAIGVRVPAPQPSDLLREIKYEIILSAADLCGVEPGLAIALATRESGLVWPERKHEAVGYFQVKPSTAAGVSKGLNVHTVFGNALAGLCYLRQLKDKEGTWEAALASYLGGPYRDREDKKVARKAHAYVADIMEGL